MVELLWKNMLVCVALEDQYVKSEVSLIKKLTNINWCLTDPAILTDINQSKPILTDPNQYFNWS